MYTNTVSFEKIVQGIVFPKILKHHCLMVSAGLQMAAIDAQISHNHRKVWVGRVLKGLLISASRWIRLLRYSQSPALIWASLRSQAAFRKKKECSNDIV